MADVCQYVCESFEYYIVTFQHRVSELTKLRGGRVPGGVHRVSYQFISVICFFNFECLLKFNVQSASVECGMATGCVKILRKALDFNHDGKYIPEHKRGPDIDLFRNQSVSQSKSKQLLTVTVEEVFGSLDQNFLIQVKICQFLKH